MAALRNEAPFAALAFHAAHIAEETSKRSRVWTGSLAAPERSAATAVSFHDVAIERRPSVWGVQSGWRYDVDALGACGVDIRGTLMSTILSARTSRTTLFAPQG